MQARRRPGRLARLLNYAAPMPLPFTVPVLSRGFAALTSGARASGGAAIAAIAPALSELLGMPVTVSGRPLPAVAARAAGMARVGLALEAVPATGALEIEARLVARAIERLGARAARTPAAAVASAAEQTFLELVALAAAAPARPAAVALGARVIAGAAPPVASDALAIALDVEVGGDRGEGRLLLPAAAVAALDTPGDAAPASGLSVPASLRDGAVVLARDELAALASGDVLLVDPAPPELVLPGGASLRGRRGDGLFTVEEIRMSDLQPSFPITLSVEIARVPVRVADLARLAPGVALPLGVPSDGAVVLRAGEHAVARGHLVDVDGALGVRVAEVGDRP